LAIVIREMQSGIVSGRLPRHFRPAPPLLPANLRNVAMLSLTRLCCQKSFSCQNGKRSSWQGQLAKTKAGKFVYRAAKLFSFLYTQHIIYILV